MKKCSGSEPNPRRGFYSSSLEIKKAFAKNEPLFANLAKIESKSGFEKIPVVICIPIVACTLI